MKYYAVYDVQLDGFKSGLAFESYGEALESVLDRIYTLHEDFLEERYEDFDEFKNAKDITDIELVQLLDYDIRYVDKNQYETILNSDNIGMTKTVDIGGN